MAWLIRVLIVAAAIAAVVWVYERWRGGVFDEGDTAGAARVHAQWDVDVRKRDTEKLRLIAQAREEERKQAAAVVEGERHAREESERKAAADRASAARAERAVGGLSGNIAALNRAARDLGIPGAAACPGEFARQRDAAVRARDLLGSCGTAYRDLGQATDDAWRAVTLKLDTALSYINAVAPRSAP